MISLNISWLINIVSNRTFKYFANLSEICAFNKYLVTFKYIFRFV